MEKIQPILIIATVISVLMIAAIAVNYLKKSKGRQGEKKVAAVLKKSGKSRGCRLINNAYLPLYKGSCEVDHILIGDFGVLVVETKSISQVPEKILPTKSVAKHILFIILSYRIKPTLIISLIIFRKQA